MIVPSAFSFYLLCSIFDCRNNRVPSIATDESSSSGQNNLTSNTIFKRTVTTVLNENPVVITKSGAVKGYLMNVKSGRQIFAFEGIPFAQPPVGNLRFKNPEPVKPWRGIRDAMSYNTYCLQLNPLRGLRVIGSEDCLYLSIYTPQVKKNSKFPVLVFIHEGSFFWGGGIDFGPSYMLKEDVILGIINYRQGPLGFLSTGDEESPGNYGLKDQALAIKWLSENIEAFGGDKNKITLLGQSSGGASVHLQMLSSTSVAKGLFASAISLSGTALNAWAFQRPEYAQKWTEKLARRVSCPTKFGSRYLMKCLKSVDPNFLVGQTINLFELFAFPMVLFAPTIEPKNVSGAFITEYPEVIYEEKEVAKIPWISTSVISEAAFAVMLMRNTLTLSFYTRNFKKYGAKILFLEGFHDNSSSIVEKASRYYGIGDYAEKYDPYGFALAKIATHRMFILGISKSISLHSGLAPTYGGLFWFSSYIGIARTLLATPPDMYGATHNDDLSMLFNSSAFFLPMNKYGKKSDHDISDFLINVFTRFADIGKPLYKDSRGTYQYVWTPVGDPTDLVFLKVNNTGVEMTSNPFSKQLSFWQNLGVTS